VVVAAFNPVMRVAICGAQLRANYTTGKGGLPETKGKRLG
jgi:hypothetical protein